ncbi:hypothetical protein SXIM_21470 [Streptomyces xiamenensis]|uniref:Uncharacterized protein n=1 Tax=Streptomyces xiamenensis TaxID=408015 RepID=A0A0F7CNU7_9ACTN|nr:hypothetical protein SXIM_21470 [Streptomyces xiamenensis]
MDTEHAVPPAPCRDFPLMPCFPTTSAAASVSFHAEVQRPGAGPRGGQRRGVHSRAHDRRGTV